VHVVFRFDTGGLENGLVNLLNGLPRERFRHAVVSLTEVTDFRRRVRRDDVAFLELHKAPGHAFALYPRLYRLFRELRPTIVHTRNLAALEATVPAWCARVPVRIHGEHGRDVSDLDGSNRRYRFLRRAHRPFVTHFVALSRDLERSLERGAGVPASRITRIVNGVDTDRFRPTERPTMPDGCPFRDSRHCLVGTVGRLQPVKNQVQLARAFVRALELVPELRDRLRLVVVGEGPLAVEISRILTRGAASDLAWLPGARNDIPEVLRGLDVFVLPSLAEGISNTLLEAMASGLPVIATNVGGNAELVEDDVTGTLVPPGDVDALARALLRYADPALARGTGKAGRVRVEQRFSLDAMITNYADLYERMVRTSNAEARALAPTHPFTTGSR
jgi:sugar transferase (PEP-CTERM/EpsH1 system associated)